MKAAKVYVRPELASDETTALDFGSLDLAIRNTQLAHAVATAAERATRHEPCFSDVLVVALVPLIERGLGALDQAEARRP